MSNKYRITEDNLIKFSTYRGILMNGLIIDLLNGKKHIVKGYQDNQYWKIVPNNGYFSAYKVEG
jgi:hypothetical protein